MKTEKWIKENKFSVFTLLILFLLFIYFDDFFFLLLGGMYAMSLIHIEEQDKLESRIIKLERRKK